MIESDRLTRRIFKVEQFRVMFEVDTQGTTTWTCHCADFTRLQGTGAHCLHVAMAIDQVMEETTDKVYWHTQIARRRVDRSPLPSLPPAATLEPQNRQQDAESNQP
jgi:hypothetical protein